MDWLWNSRAKKNSKRKPEPSPPLFFLEKGAAARRADVRLALRVHQWLPAGRPDGRALCVRRVAGRVRRGAGRSLRRRRRARV